MKSAQFEPYVTVAQAADQLSVHPSTIRRWVDRGRLPAYRLGEKRIVLKPSDLAKLVAPRPPRLDKGEPIAQPWRLVIPQLTPEQQRRGLLALAELDRLRNELAAKYGPLEPESWEVLHQSRDERTRDIERALR